MESGGTGWWVRVDVTTEFKLCENLKEKNPGWGQGGCDHRIEVILKIQKKSERGVRSGRGWGEVEGCGLVEGEGLLVARLEAGVMWGTGDVNQE